MEDGDREELCKSDFLKFILSFVFMNVGEYSLILCSISWYCISLVSACVCGDQCWLSRAEQKARGKSGSGLRA